MRKRKNIFTCVLCTLFVLFVMKYGAQNQKLDSLRRKVLISSPDTNKLNTLLYFSRMLSIKDPDTALIVGRQALSLADQLLNNKDAQVISCAKRGKARALFCVAMFYKFKFEFDSSVFYFTRSLTAATVTGDRNVLLQTNSQLATVYHLKSDFPNSVKYNLVTFELSKELKDIEMEHTVLTNMGLIYFKQGEFEKAIQYHTKAIELAQRTKKMGELSNDLSNLGIVYQGMKDDARTLAYFQKALAISKDLPDLSLHSRNLGNLANYYAVKNMNEQAVVYYEEALELAKASGVPRILSGALGNLGSTYTFMKKYKEAEKLIKQALKISFQIDDKLYKRDQLGMLYELYERTGKHALALEYYKKHIALSDSLFSQENNKKLMRNEMDHEYEKKKAVADAEHKLEIKNQKLIADERSKKQSVIIASVIGGLILVMIFAAFVFRSLRITNKQKQIIEHKNKETEEQKKEIEEKQKEILDSIHYAKRIQMAQIPSEKFISRVLQRLKK